MAQLQMLGETKRDLLSLVLRSWRVLMVAGFNIVGLPIRTASTNAPSIHIERAFKAQGRTH